VHWCWLRLAGGSAERRLTRALAASLPPAGRLLDAGCGTGRLARRVRSARPDVHLTLLDASAAMLSLVADVPGDRVRGTVLDLPFAHDRFDTVISAWVLETLNDPDRALEQCARVLRPGGYLLYCFSSMPAGRVRRTLSGPIRRVVETRFAGSFLGHDPQAPDGCRAVHRFRSRAGLATTVVLRKEHPAPPA
jgi:ubiquinone/menaquinone biosynthesis C-methylase UbiE